MSYIPSNLRGVFTVDRGQGWVRLIGAERGWDDDGRDEMNDVIIGRSGLLGLVMMCCILRYSEWG